MFLSNVSALLKFESHPGGQGMFRIYGEYAQKYLCFSRKGRLIVRVSTIVLKTSCTCLHFVVFLLLTDWVFPFYTRLSSSFLPFDLFPLHLPSIFISSHVIYFLNLREIPSSRTCFTFFLLHTTLAGQGRQSHFTQDRENLTLT